MIYEASPLAVVVFLAIMGISWFWFFGIYVLNQVPSFVSQRLSGDQTVVTTMMATFSIGIGIGSMLCARWSGKVVEIGLVPLGAFGVGLRHTVATNQQARERDRFGAKNDLFIDALSRRQHQAPALCQHARR